MSYDLEISKWYNWLSSQFLLSNFAFLYVLSYDLNVQQLNNSDDVFSLNLIYLKCINLSLNRVVIFNHENLK